MHHHNYGIPLMYFLDLHRVVLDSDEVGRHPTDRATEVDYPLVSFFVTLYTNQLSNRMCKNTAF